MRPKWSADELRPVMARWFAYGNEGRRASRKNAGIAATDQPRGISAARGVFSAFACVFRCVSPRRNRRIYYRLTRSFILRVHTYIRHRESFEHNKISSGRISFALRLFPSHRPFCFALSAPARLHAWPGACTRYCCCCYRNKHRTPRRAAEDDDVRLVLLILLCSSRTMTACRAVALRVSVFGKHSYIRN